MDRNDYGSGDRVRLLPSMDRRGLELHGAEASDARLIRREPVDNASGRGTPLPSLSFAADGEGWGVANGSSRVTVVSPDRRVDLSLPGSVPISDLLGQLLDVCTDHADRSAPLAWTLRPVGGCALALTSTLESARVHDGTVLELCARSQSALPTTVEDVRDATEDAVDRTIGAWSRRDTTTVAALVLGVLSAVLLARPSVWTGLPGNGLPCAAGMAGVLLAAAVRIIRHDLVVAAHGLLAAGLAWTGALGFAAPVTLASTELTPASRAGVCAAAVLAAAILVAWAEPQLAAWVAAAAVCVIASGGWTAMELAGRSADQAVALGTVVGVLSLGVLPRASLAAGGLAGLDYLVRTRGSVDQSAVTATFARSRSLLNGALVATAGLTATGAVRLGLAGSSAQLALAVMIGGCLLLRARAFTQTRHVLTLVATGACALLVQLTADLLAHQPRPTTLAAMLLVAASSALMVRGGLSAHNDVASARSRRLLDVTESLAIATLIPLLAANLGVLDWVRELVS